MAREKRGDVDLEADVTKLVEDTLKLAVLNRASDVHIEPEVERVRVRYRIDGVLREAATHPRSFLDPMVARVKIMANLDLAEHRRPLEGRFQLAVEGRSLDVRVSVVPTIQGENVSLRLLDKSAILVGLDQLGMGETELAQYQQLVRRPYGIIFVTGPSGSGKTTSMYATLNTINSVDRNIVTLEDPVEYQLPMLRQTEVDPRVELDFAGGLRALLRQDPDVVLVGEVRDTQTAEIAVRAALTGHLVFTSLHTNDSVGAISRLTEMGVEPVLLASATLGIVAQRLVRTVCPACAEAYRAPRELLERLGIPGEPNATLVRAKGCDQCGFTGYHGRTGIFELFVPTPEIRALITAQASVDVITKVVRQEGMRPLREHGWEKVLSRVTTVEEVLRVTNADPTAAELT